MIGGILLLVVVVYGIIILFGRGKIEDYLKFLIWLIFAPVLLAIGINHVVWFWCGLPWWMQIFSVLFLPFFVSIILRTLFPKAVWLQKLQNASFEILIYIVTFPFRLIWRTYRQISDREHHRIRLQRNRPVVGHRPPLRHDREEIRIGGITDGKNRN